MQYPYREAEIAKNPHPLKRMSSGTAFQKRPHDSVTAEPQPSVNAAERAKEAAQIRRKGQRPAFPRRRE